MIDYLIVHHFGGYANDPYASTQWLREETLQNAHAQRWPEFKSELNGSNIGYNIVIYPTYWAQYRLIGEETAANKGYNHNSVSIAIAGNYNLLGGRAVDTMTKYQGDTFEKLGKAILNGRAKEEGLQIKEGTEIVIPLANIVPHRYVSPTECYGSGLADAWAKNQLVSIDQKKLFDLQQMLNEMRRVLNLFKAKQFGGTVSCFDADNK